MKASILIRAYNAEATIARTLRSALHQDVDEQYEVIVVDDGSTDGTPDVVEHYAADDRIRLIRQKNGGTARAASAGLAASRGNIVILLDADDESVPTMLRDASSALSDRSFDYAFGDYVEEYRGVEKLVVASDPFKAPAGAFAWRRDSLVAAGGFQAETVFPEYELLLRTWDTWKGTHIAKPLFVYHRRDASITGDKAAVMDGIAHLRKKFPDREREIDMIRNYDPLAI